MLLPKATSSDMISAPHARSSAAVVIGSPRGTDLTPCHATPCHVPEAERPQGFLQHKTKHGHTSSAGPQLLWYLSKPCPNPVLMLISTWWGCSGFTWLKGVVMPGSSEVFSCFRHA